MMKKRREIVLIDGNPPPPHLQINRAMIVAIIDQVEAMARANLKIKREQ